MIPRLTEGGQSFKGAALYYLHDKREEGEAERGTAARVAWTYALNLPTQDPDRAWRMMTHTAMSQAELKKAAGIKATGRKLKKPVMAYSLSWSPDEEQPDPHAMLEAAQASLAALGLEEHQALVVCHTDTAHPHVHLIVNRVHPETGLAHKGSVSKLRLSEWAESYELQCGQIQVEARVANNAKRRQRRADRTAAPADRQKQRPRPQWQAARSDRDYAEALAAVQADRFADQAGRERAGQAVRWQAEADFWSERRAARAAIRDRYQAALDGARDPRQAAHNERLATLLIDAEPALSLEAMTRDRSTFSRQDLARHVGRHTHTADEFRAVLDRLESSPELVALARDDKGHQRFTTREQQAVERSMANHAQALHSGRHGIVPAVWPKGMALSKDQDTALKHVLDRERLASVIGYAGTGKSTMLNAARRSWEAAGYRVQGMALSGIAADGLKNGAGIDSRTIHSRVGQWEQGINQPGPKDVIVVDEAGMIGSKQMEQILRHADHGRAKVVLVGDPEQLQAIDAGGAFRAIVDRTGAAELNTVRRQVSDWQKQATCELATGHTADALDRYEQAGMIHAHEEVDTARAALIDGWRQARTENPKQSQIILAFTRADVRDLNDRARATLKQTGELGQDVPLKTDAGRRDFATGDRIYFMKNDAGLGVRNGSLATIERIKGQSIVARLDGPEGRRVMFGMNAYNHIDHGYAATIHKSQGVTVDRTHMLATPNFNRHLAYVAMTRHRERVDLHWSKDAFPSRAGMVRTLSRQAAKDTTLDYEAAPASHEPPRAKAHAPQRDPKDRHAHAFRRSAAANNAAPPRKVSGRTAVEEAQQAVRALHRQETTDRRHGHLAARQHEEDSHEAAPVSEKVARATITHTAEIAAFDAETTRLAADMRQRHNAEIDIEDIARAEMVLEAAGLWREASLMPIERAAQQQRQGRTFEDDERQDQQQQGRAISPRFEP